MNSLLKSIVFLLSLYSLALLLWGAAIAVIIITLTGCTAPQVQSTKSKVQSWWETQNVTNPNSIILKAIRDGTNIQIIIPICTNAPILTPQSIPVGFSKFKVSTVAKLPVPMIRLSWNTEWRDTKGNVQPDAVSIVRSSIDIKTVKQGIIRLIARTNQITVPCTEQQEFFVVANDYARNYTN